MRYGAMNIPIHPVLEGVARCASLGFDYMELTLDAPDGHYTVIRNQKDELAAALRRNNLGLICHLPTFVYTADLTESIRRVSVEEMRHSIAVAAELGAEKAVLHPGLVMGLGPLVLERALALAFESLDILADTARGVGLTLCVENMPPNCGAFIEPDEFDVVFKRYPEFQMTLDVGHANIRDEKGGRVFELIRRFGDRISHLHISDNRGKRDDHLPLGQGIIDFAAIARKISEIGRAETATLEIFEEAEKGLPASLVRFRKLMDSLAS